MKTIKEAATNFLKELSLDELLEGVKPTEAFESGAVWAERWIPIEEELPEPEEIILIEYSYRGRENISTAVRKEDNENGDCYVTTDGGIMIYPDEITHWRPVKHK